MQCTAATLTEFAANPRWLGGIGSFTLVLHTWTQDLRRHLHVYALMACGGLQLGADGAGAWVRPKRSPNFLFPVHALSKVFRGKFMQALHDAIEAGMLPRDPADTALARGQRVQALRRHDWVVYAKTPLAGAAMVLDYLSRYTHRTAIGNERLVCIEGNRLHFRVRADDTGGKRTISMDGRQFIGRFLQHVLPPRQLLSMPAANEQAREDAQAFMRRVAAIEIACCPHCATGRWQLLQTRCAERSALAALSPTGCRGPP